MAQAELLIAGLLVAVAGLSVLARRLSVPYPIVLVIGGALFGFIPGLPAVKLDPQVVLVVFLPPLVYGAAVYANFNDLGAIVSPTDPLASAAIMRRLDAPRRMVSAIEGEGLFNDVTALVAYRVAVGAVVAGSFSLANAGLSFLLGAAGGVAVGLAVGAAVAEIRRRVTDPQVSVTISLLT